MKGRGGRRGGSLQYYRGQNSPAGIGLKKTVEYSLLTQKDSRILISAMVKR